MMIAMKCGAVVVAIFGVLAITARASADDESDRAAAALADRAVSMKCLVIRLTAVVDVVRQIDAFPRAELLRWEDDDPSLLLSALPSTSASNVWLPLDPRRNLRG